MTTNSRHLRLTSVWSMTLKIALCHFSPSQNMCLICAGTVWSHSYSEPTTLPSRILKVVDHNNLTIYIYPCYPTENPNSFGLAELRYQDLYRRRLLDRKVSRMYR